MKSTLKPGLTHRFVVVWDRFTSKVAAKAFAAEKATA